MPRHILTAFALLTALPAFAADTCSLAITLRDAATGEVLPGLLRARAADGSILPVPGALDRFTGLSSRRKAAGWHAILPGDALELPRSALVLEAFHGLDIVFLSHLERALVDRTYISNTFTREDLAELSGEGLLFGNGEEHRHNFGAGGEGYGDVMLLDIRELIRPVSIGLRVPFSTGTDWFIDDFSRAYVPIEGPPSTARWLSQLAAGRSTITNGPLLEFEVAGEKPGAGIPLPAPSALAVRARALGRVDFTELQIVRNGEVIRSAPSRAVGGHFEAELAFDVEIGAPSWLAARIECQSRNELDRPLFAHTSPVYVSVDGQACFDPEAGRGLVDDMRAAIATVEEKAVFANDAERESVLDIHREAIRQLESRLQTEE